MINAFLFLSFIPLWLMIIISICESIFANINYNGTSSFKEIYFNNIYGLHIILIIIIGFVFSVIILKYSLKKIKVNSVSNYNIKKIDSLRNESVNYLLANTLPLIAFDFNNPFEIFQFLTLYYLLTRLHKKHNLISTNIFLEFLGYKIYNCELENNGFTFSKKILTREKLHKTGKLQYNISKITDEIFFLTDIDN